jgi:ribosomal protein S9
MRSAAIRRSRPSECLRRRTIDLFLKLGLIAQRLAETLLCWNTRGFSVDSSVRLGGGHHKARQALAQYIARALLSFQKLARANWLDITIASRLLAVRAGVWLF